MTSPPVCWVFASRFVAHHGNFGQSWCKVPPESCYPGFCPPFQDASIRRKLLSRAVTPRHGPSRRASRSEQTLKVLDESRPRQTLPFQNSTITERRLDDQHHCVVKQSARALCHDLIKRTYRTDLLFLADPQLGRISGVDGTLSEVDTQALPRSVPGSCHRLRTSSIFVVRSGLPKSSTSNRSPHSASHIEMMAFHKGSELLRFISDGDATS